LEDIANNNEAAWARMAQAVYLASSALMAAMPKQNKIMFVSSDNKIGHF
jgi:hypothetical protein